MKQQFFAIAFFCLIIMAPTQAQVFKTNDKPNLTFIDKAHYISAAMYREKSIRPNMVSVVPPMLVPR